MTKAVVMGVALLACASSMGAQARSAAPSPELSAAQRALAGGDYADAFARYKRLALRNPQAQFTLGLFFREGWGRVKDPVQACGWFERAAARHIPTAEHFWGDCLAEGIGRPVDIPAAIVWYDRAGADGHLTSWCTEGGFYFRGRGVAQDIERGLSLCQKAAQAGSPPAMLSLARFLDEADGASRNKVLARYWYQQAAEFHVQEAQFRLGQMLIGGEGGEADPNTGLFWFEAAASDGYVPAYLPTALMYANTPIDPQTGGLKAECLAKTYLWTMAAKARVKDPDQRKEVAALEASVLKLMPPGWRGDLDKKVAAHLEKFSLP